MLRFFARVLSNSLCAIGILFLFFFVCFIIIGPAATIPKTVFWVMVVWSGCAAWILDDWREATGREEREENG